MSEQQTELAGISARRRAYDEALLHVFDRLAGCVARRWLLTVNLLMLILAGGAFVPPFLLAQGLRLPAQAVYFFYSFMCHQLPYRSYFLLGYQVAQCQRNTAIYGSLFVAGIAFALLRSRIKPLGWRLFTLLILPMALDGTTQLFGWRESDWQLRTITGTLFGIAVVWLVYPRIDLWLTKSKQYQSEPRSHRVVIYGKEDCSLCDKAKAIVAGLSADYNLEVKEIDVTKYPHLYKKYGDLIPVVHIDGRVAAVSKVSEVWLRRTLDGTR